MGLSLGLYVFLIFILQLQFVHYYYPTQAFSYYPPPHNHSIRPYEQSLALLQFKQQFIIDSYASSDCYNSQPKTKSWNRTIDCCRWEGVTCDGLTGHVLGLDLSCSQLQGTIHSNSTLFKLFQLKKLNLAFNDFPLSRISHKFGGFASLTHLNLSNSNFAEHIPSEISHLSNLVSLDLSSLSDIKLETNNFQMLLQNLTQLRQLSLSWVNISSAVFPVNISSSLKLLDLSLTRLHGNLPSEVLKLPNLQVLRLYDNEDLNIYLPEAADVRSSSPFRLLDLSYCNIFGNLPEWLGNLTHVTHLSLSNINFSGGQILDFVVKLRQLGHLDLQSSNFSGTIPSSISNLTQLVNLHLSDNSLTGAIPSSIGNLTQLSNLYVSKNSLTGPIPSTIGNLTQLAYIDLSSNSLIGPIPSSIGNLTQLLMLDLSSNSLTGPIPPSICNLTQLLLLALSSNLLTGPIPHSITKLRALFDLKLSRNNLIGNVELSMFYNLPDLSTLDLSNNNLSVRTANIDINATFPNLQVLGLSSCKVKEFPDFLRSNNDISVLDLRQNILQGPLPSTICNLTSLEILDLSHNNLSGEILPCLGNFSTELHVLNLEANNFHGTIPTKFAEGNNFVNLNFNSNQLEGKLPHSLANCKHLKVLDLGNNHLNDTFPAWLGTLPELMVLVLKSNRLHGSIPNSAHTKSPFSMLQIIDFSNNEFSGHLPSKYFRYIEDRTEVQGYSTKPEYMSITYYNGREIYYGYSITVVMKGTERELDKILTAFTAIDMSNNKFEGEIPNYIGNLTSLRELNLSHNKLVGHIPPSLGKLSVLESLDLSFNQLKGEIPQQLTGLISLAFLNLSQNHLVGCIPQGKQFNTFDNDSYSGNSALRGFSLSKDCGGEETPHQH